MTDYRHPSRFTTAHSATLDIQQVHINLFAPNDIHDEWAWAGLALLLFTIGEATTLKRQRTRWPYGFSPPRDWDDLISGYVWVLEDLARLIRRHGVDVRARHLWPESVCYPRPVERIDSDPWW